MREEYYYGWPKFVYLIKYVTKNSGIHETYSERLRLFKDNDDASFEFFSAIACDVCESEFSGIDIVVRALGHEELEASGNSPLDRLGIKIADRINAQYLPQILYKTKEIPYLKGKSNREKMEILKDAYDLHLENIPAQDSQRILLIDDLYTAGTTARAIKQELTKSSSFDSIELFTLGRTVWEEDALDVDNGKVLGGYLDELGFDSTII